MTTRNGGRNPKYIGLSSTGIPSIRISSRCAAPLARHTPNPHFEPPLATSAHNELPCLIFFYFFCSHLFTLFGFAIARSSETTRSSTGATLGYFSLCASTSRVRHPISFSSRLFHTTGIICFKRPSTTRQFVDAPHQALLHDVLTVN